MEQGRGGNRWRTGIVVVGFAALAVLAGPVRGYTSSEFDSATHFQTLSGGALSGMIAGIVLLLLGTVRREGMLRGHQWLALFVLLLPQWLAQPLTAPYIRSIPWLHETRWGLAFMLTLAAPLWLALLSALELVSVEVPRAVVGAAIAGIGAAYLVFPVDAYSIAPNQAPVLVVQLLLNLLGCVQLGIRGSAAYGYGNTGCGGIVSSTERARRYGLWSAV
jgi:hypothetical protein